MAGDWIKVEHVTPDKPEVVALAGMLNIDQDAVTGKLLRLWIWADQQLNGCHAITVTNSFIDRLTFCPGFAAGLVKVGWLEGREGRLSIPHFDRHNGQTAKNRALANNRKKNERGKSHAGSVTNVTEEALQNRDQRREEKSNEEEEEKARGRSRIIPEDVAAVSAYVRTLHAIQLTEEDRAAFAEWYFSTNDERGWVAGPYNAPITKWKAHCGRMAAKWANRRTELAGKPDNGTMSDEKYDF